MKNFKLFSFKFKTIVLLSVCFIGLKTYAQLVNGIDNKGSIIDVRNNQVFYLQNGAALSTIVTPLNGDELFFTDTGDSSGIISNNYIYDGTSWVLRTTQNAVPLWISNTNGGVYLLNDIINYSGALYKNITATNTNTTPDLDSTNWEYLQITTPIMAYGKVDSNGAALRIFGATVTRTSTGRYTVTLDIARSTAHYIINLTVVEDVNTRDDINIYVTSQTTTAFTVSVNEGDNGDTANTNRDRDWYFTVIDF